MTTYRHDDPRIAELRNELARAQQERDEALEMRDEAERELKNSRAYERFRSGTRLIVAACLTGMMFGLLVFIGQGLRSCATAEEITAGFVTDRIHYEARTVCTSTGKTTTCTPIPERWSVIISHHGVEREVDLEHDRWMRTYGGQWLCVEQPCDTNEISEER